jgi:hypothetical protein
MVNVMRSAGHGMLAAGAFLIFLYLFATYLKSPDAFYDAFNPLAISTYLMLLPLMPGTFLLWLSDQLFARRQHQPDGRPNETC